MSSNKVSNHHQLVIANLMDLMRRIYIHSLRFTHTKVLSKHAKHRSPLIILLRYPYRKTGDGVLGSMP